MIKQNTLLPAQVRPCDKEQTKGIPFQSFIRQTIQQEQRSTILSVYGGKAFNRYLANAVPHHTKLHTVQHDLHKVYGKTLFDLLIYTVKPRPPGREQLLEELCYCRMLIKPGGTLFLLKEIDNATWLPIRYFIPIKKESTWLRHAGFCNIQRRPVKDGFVLSGQRPWQRY